MRENLLKKKIQNGESAIGTFVKLTDPAVISVDERGSFVIPLLAGHIGGANELSRCLAAALGATACVTTATDVKRPFRC